MGKNGLSSWWSEHRINYRSDFKMNKNKQKHKWALDFTVKLPQDRDMQIATMSDLGYKKDISFADEKTREANPNLVSKKSWEVATGPFKQLPMNLFIMWMAGNTISIFPIMMVGMMFIRPIQALLAAQQTFKMIESNHAVLQRAVYVLGNIACLMLATYKCQVMGLLPTHPSDWLAFIEPQSRHEWSGGGISI